MLLPNYTRFEEVSRRLCDSVIRYNGDPVYVTHVRYDPQTSAPDPAPVEYRYGNIYRGWLYMPQNFEFSDLLEWLEEDARRWDWWCDNYGDPRDAEYPMDHYFDAIEGFNRMRNGPSVTPPSRLDMCDIVASAFKIDTQEAVEFRLNDRGVNLVPVQLGYVNYPRDCSYVSRIPDRRCYKQGLSSQSIKSSRGGVMLSDDRYLAETIRGNFPTLRECLSEIAGSDSVNRRAFHRHLAVEVDRDLGIGYLEYKGKRIGHSPDCIKWNVSPKYHFMREILIDNDMEIAS